jgi:hypothetical protein
LARPFEKQFRLVEASFTPPNLVQWHRDNQVPLQRLAILTNDLCQAIRKPVGQRPHLFKFQQDDGANERTLVPRKAPRPVKVEFFAAAFDRNISPECAKTKPGNLRRPPAAMCLSGAARKAGGRLAKRR